MDRLPVEVIESILNQPVLNIEDLLNVSSTCTYLRTVVNNNQSIWRTVFQLKWPQVLEDMQPVTNVNYYDEALRCHQLRSQILRMLETMPKRFCKKYELSDCDLGEWKALVEEHLSPNAIHYVIHHLRDIVNTSRSIDSLHVVALTTPGNRTLRYYASKALRQLVQLHLSTTIWPQFIALPVAQQLLEVGAVFVAQWCLPHQRITCQEIAEKLDRIVRLVRQHLYDLNPNHQLFRTAPEIVNSWRHRQFDDNQWSIMECREVINAMRDVIYGRLGFHGNNQSYYAPENSFINEVLDNKLGLPITMAIVYESVGRRLGCVFQPINFPAHFLLRFNESPTEWYYIDIFNAGSTLRRGTCPHSLYPPMQRRLMPTASAQQVVERMANNLEMSARQHSQPNGRVTRLRSVLELLKLVSPQDLSALVSLGKLYMLHNMNTVSLVTYMENQKFEAPDQALRILNMLRDYDFHQQQTFESEIDDFQKVEVAQRSDELLFAVGMVMHHLTLNYKCVIYDWDPICLATASWQSEMNVSMLRYKSEQPFYNVLVEDGSYRYVAQENLRPCSDIGSLRLNEDLGRHFSHFFQNHYVPNAEKNLEYPFDEEVRHRFYYEWSSGGK